VSVQEFDPTDESPRSSTLDETNIERVREALERERQRRPLSSLSNVSSAEVTDDEGQDYDWRLQQDSPQPVPSPLPLEPITSAGSGDSRENRRVENLLLDHNMNEHVRGYIPMGETDGLPNIKHTETVDDLKAATDIVRAHTGKWGVLRRRVKAVSHAKNFASMTSGPSIKTQLNADPADNENRKSSGYSSEDEDDHSIRMPNLPEGASVLSSLLALYGQNRPGMRSERTSVASSVGTLTEDESSDEDERRKKEVERTTGVQIHDRHRPSITGSESPNRPQMRRIASDGSVRPDQQVEPGFMKAIKRAKEHWMERDRPKSARNGAGVIGALIQNTANLSAAATPHASTLAPAAKRPGYQLNRYSLPDINGPDVSQPWRPSSRPGSRANSRPPSIHSSTVVSETPPDAKSTVSDDQFSKRKAYSDDQLSSMKEEKKRAASVDELSTKTGEKRKPKMNLGELGKLPVSALKASGHVLHNAENWIMSGGKTPLFTPDEKSGFEFFTPRSLTEEDIRRKEREKERKKRKKERDARKKQEIYIIQHVAAYIQRQQFLLKLARALMMFGSPSHRLETQIQATARVLEINAQVIYLPGTMLISFGDDTTHTSEVKFLKQATGLDLGKLLATHHLYWNVVHDRMSVDQASKDLDVLMTTPVYYSWWQVLLIGAMCSAFITVISFYGSFIDALIAMPLGMLLCGVQILVARNDMLSNVFEISIACIISFISAALASTGYFCYTSLVSGGVVLILPGYIVLCGSLELASRNITSGAVRIGYSVIYSLFLGFGITIGAEIYRKITGLEVVGPDDYTYFLCCPAYSFWLSLRNQQPLFAKELPIMVLISVAGWVSNHFSGLAFPGRSDIVSAIGSFVVGTLGNLYGRFSHGSSFPVTVTGILFQLPSGLANGGIFNFAAEQNGTQAWSDGFDVAEQLVSVAIGLTVGLFVSAVITHPFGGPRRAGSGVFSF
ncbi:hypothetical protein TREMEDRAFT_25485, partial [Tremella mesenterica DSM 1558]|uniref:uncharacterized protein n=1 Tax=Tremella mesenterica (strain ATCC 24925 / CBS 8224 / DSM 1558 / NBRC 9311 / NRRL Y-6157 / RJB 2259-6 / UBC 559-6) TaxID=578456 RepID=UPI0003F48E65